MRKPNIRMIKENDAIIKMIQDAPTTWISTDWHAVKFDKQTKAISKREEYDAIKKACSVIKPDDVWIYLGDIIDSEIQRKETITEVLDCVNTEKRILLLGNNDRFESYDKWFTYVENVILLPEDHAVLSHCPIPNDEKINIHGHIHVHEPGYGTAGAYWKMYDIDPGNHVNAFTYPHKPVSLEALLKRKPSCYVQRIQGMRGKPYTQDLVNNEIHDYEILRKHYDKIEEDMRDAVLKG